MRKYTVGLIILRTPLWTADSLSSLSVWVWIASILSYCIYSPWFALGSRYTHPSLLDLGWESQSLIQNHGHGSLMTSKSQDPRLASLSHIYYYKLYPFGLSNSQSFSCNRNLVFVLEIGKKKVSKGVIYFWWATICCLDTMQSQDSICSKTPKYAPRGARRMNAR